MARSMTKHGEFTWEQIALIILALAFLIWVLFFSGSIGTAIKESAGRLLRIFR